MTYDAIIVGGGLAGLTAAAFISKNNKKVLVCEKESEIGGLVSSFEYNGFTFDGGIRAIENSGIVYPMLRMLGIEIDFLPNVVSIGIGNEVIRVTSKDSIEDYKQLLYKTFPDNKTDTDSIIEQIHIIMKYMEILYGIDNPIFLDFKKDRDYLIKTMVPWIFKYIATYRKIAKLNIPVEQFLTKFSSNPDFIDMIAQHFFKQTPAFFAMSYFSLYLDYKYPKGGTGTLIRKLEEFIISHGGEINRNTKISVVNPENHSLSDLSGNVYNYSKLIWACDRKALYHLISIDNLNNPKTKETVIAQRNFLADKQGGDSVLTLYLMVSLEKAYFENICSPHFFYTPKKSGLHNVKIEDIIDRGAINSNLEFSEDKDKIFHWLSLFLEYTTYEISSPVMRDSSLAPEGKTGLIISSLIEYSLVKHIYRLGWGDEFKELVKSKVIDVLDGSIFNGLKSKYLDSFMSTPLTIETRTGNTGGAITGWAFYNNPMPAVSSLPGIAKSVNTPIKDIYQAGQWSYSPSGLPISILTGKLAADKI